MLDSDLTLLLHGSTAALPEQIPLRAGPLTLIFEAGDLRRISLNGRELVRRIYGAIRDRDWGTVPGERSQFMIASESHRFQVSYVSEHREGAIDFVWRANIEGAPDGTITFGFSGEARTSFERNRIGLCVLHPIRECAGAMAKAHLITGEQIDVQFPELVAVEQPIEGFAELARLTYEADDESQIEVAFEGDVFETEDQRNWLDASYKTYSTRVSLPRPVLVPAGTRVEQRVTIRLHAPGRVQLAHAVRSARSVAAAAERGETPMPRIGVGGGGLDGGSSRSIALLKDLRPAHLRLDLTLDGGGWQPRLESALNAQRDIGIGLEVALHVGPASGTDLEALAKLLPVPSPLVRLLVFDHDPQTTTSEGALAIVRERLLALRPDVGPLGAGSRIDLFQLHLSPPPSADVICWPMNPHAHAPDVTSLAETPPTAGDQVRSVRARYPGRTTAVTPVTLAPRTAPSEAAARGPHPLHASLFGAAWTLAMASHIAKAGAASATFFSDVRELGSIDAHPVFHVLADLCECLDGSVIAPPELDEDDTLGSLVVQRPYAAVLLLANLTQDPRTVSIPRAFRPQSSRVLDATTASRAAANRDAFRRERRDVPSMTTVELGPFATARLDGDIMEPR